MNIIKKISVGGYITLGAAVLALIALIVGAVSCSGDGFAPAQLPTIITFSIFAIILIAGAVIYSAFRDDDIITTILVLAGAVLLILCVFNMIDGKEDVLGTVLFSDLEKGFAQAEFACYVGVASIVLYIVSVIALAVGSLLKFNKAE